MPATDYLIILVMALPGLGVWAAGQGLVFVGARSGGSSPIGLRLTLLGLGLATLGPIAALVVGAVAAGLWVLTLALIVGVGWLPFVFFWLATRPRVTMEESPPPSG